MPNSDFQFGEGEAEAISRLSALEQLREQARAAGRSAMIENIEKMIEAELHTLQRLRKSRTEDPVG